MKRNCSFFVPFKVAELFKLHPQNRDIDPRHVAELKKMMRNSPNTIPAICVNRATKIIIDGQHRWKAYLELVSEGTWPHDTELEVKFVDVPVEDELKYIIEAQKGTKPWYNEDYVSAHVIGGNESYVKLSDWTKSHELTCAGGKPKYTYAIIMMKGVKASSIIRDGKLVVTDEDLAVGDAVHDEIKQLAEVLGVTCAGSSFEALISKWFKVRKNHSFKSWLQYIKTHKKLNYRKNKITYSDWNDYFNEVNTELYAREFAKKAV